MDPQTLPGSESRETRLLLATIAISVVMLVVLARFRFPGNGPAETAEPAPAPLERLASQASYDELASTMADLERRVRGSLLLVRVEPGGGFVAATRVTADRAVLRLEPEQVPAASESAPAPALLGREPVSGMAVISVRAEPEHVVTPRSGAPRAGPRYIGVTDATARGIAFRPAYVGATTMADDNATGRTHLAMMTTPQAVSPGSALFTFAGTFIGIAAAVDGVVTVVPADALKAIAENPPQPAGVDFGVEVQRLGDALGRIAGATRGVMVAAVASDGPAAGVLAPGDVVQSLDGRPIASTADFHAIEQTRAPGKAFAVTFVRRGKSAAAQISTPAPAREAIPPGAEHEPGLTLRTVAGRSVVSAVKAGRAAAQAGIQAGDVITAVDGFNGGGNIPRVFRALPQGTGMLVAIERAGRHSIVALEKK